MANYYYVRYNVYADQAPPVEYEDWFELDEHHDEQKMKAFLAEKHEAGITIIRSIEINEQEFNNHDKLSR